MNQLLLAADAGAWETIIKVGSFMLALAGPAATAIYKLKPAYERNKKRTDLKADLEILKGLKESGLDSSIVEKQVAENARQVYSGDEAIRKQLHTRYADIGMRIYGFFVFAGLAYWTYALYRSHHGFTGWMILTGFFSFGGLALIFGGYKDMGKNMKKDGSAEQVKEPGQ